MTTDLLLQHMRRVGIVILTLALSLPDGTAHAKAKLPGADFFLHAQHLAGPERHDLMRVDLHCSACSCLCAARAASRASGMSPTAKSRSAA